MLIKVNKAFTGPSNWLFRLQISFLFILINKPKWVIHRNVGGISFKFKAERRAVLSDLLDCPRRQLVFFLVSAKTLKLQLSSEDLNFPHLLLSRVFDQPKPINKLDILHITARLLSAFPCQGTGHRACRRWPKN